MIDRYNCEYCSIIGENDMCEAKDGEWVRYEDIKHLLQNKPSNSDYTRCPECGEIYLNSEVQPHTGLCGYCNPPF